MTHRPHHYNLETVAVTNIYKKENVFPTKKLHIDFFTGVLTVKQTNPTPHLRNIPYTVPPALFLPSMQSFEGSIKTLQR